MQIYRSCWYVMNGETSLKSFNFLHKQDTGKIFEFPFWLHSLNSNSLLPVFRAAWEKFMWHASKLQTTCMHGYNQIIDLLW